MERTFSDQTSEADALAKFHRTLSAAAKWGITTIQDMSNDLPPERCVALLEKFPTPIQVRIMRMPGTTPAGRAILEGRPVPRISNPLITVSGTKWMLDGVPLEGTFAPRDDPATVDYFVLHEQLTFPETEIAAMLQESRHDHDQLLVHVSAYPATAMMLNAMKSAGGKQVWANQRVRFEHGDGLTPDLIPQAKELGNVVVQNPTHLATVRMSPNFDNDLWEGIKAQPLRSLLAAGASGTNLPHVRMLGPAVAKMFSFVDSMIHARRTWTCGLIGLPKSKASKRPVPLHPLLANFMLLWKQKTPYAQSCDWVFPSSRLEGKQPRVANMLVEDHLRPTAVKAVVLSSHRDIRGRLVDDDPRRFGFHNLRQSLASFVIRTRTDPKTVQTQLRHSDVKLTPQFYTHAVSRNRMAAAKILAAILRRATEQSGLKADGEGIARA